MDINTKIAKLCLRWKKAPEKMPEELFGITLSSQQLPIYLNALSYESRTIVKSATGTGKTTTLALVIFHQLLTEAEVGIMACSPSSAQLKSGLIKEVRKMLAICKIPEIVDIFEIQQDNLHRKDLRGSHYCFFRTADAQNVENLSGFHAKKTIIMIDEASAVGEDAMGALKGNLTEKGSSMIQTSNPSRSAGPFFKIFRDKPNGYQLFTLTAIDCPRISRTWIKEMEDTYGKDSDVYRVRILGEFPRSSSSLFLSSDLIEGAMKRNLDPIDYKNSQIIMGVDVARFGDDSSVIAIRQGPKLLDLSVYSGIDTMEFSGIIHDSYRRFSGVSAIVVDAVGVGAGVADRLKELGLPVIEFNAGSRSSDPRIYFNLRAEMYQLLKDWLISADIPKVQELEEELRSISYGFNSKNQLQMLTKKDMKKLGFSSPDRVDAIKFTLYQGTSGMRRVQQRRPGRGIRRVNRWG